MKNNLPDFCVSSSADGFDEFLMLYNKHFSKNYIGNLAFYGYLETESYCGREYSFATEITPLQAIALLTAKPMTEGEMRSCANCKETIQECACMRNICVKCNKPVGNITFSVCDYCWNILHPKLLEDYASSRSMESQWISVEDKKPEIGVIVNLVLKHSKEDVYSGFRANGGWYCFQVGENPKHYIPNGIENVKITHWQPLPQPPTN